MEAVVVKEVLDIAEEFVLIKQILVNFVDEIISKFVNNYFHQTVRDEIEVEIKRCSEGSCNCQTEITVLHEELSKYYDTINESSLKVQQLSVPLFSEETLILDSNEKVLF